MIPINIITRIQAILSEDSLNFLFMQLISIEIQNIKTKTAKTNIIKVRIIPRRTIPPKRFIISMQISKRWKFKKLMKSLKNISLLLQKYL